MHKHECVYAPSRACARVRTHAYAHTHTGEAPGGDRHVSEAPGGDRHESEAPGGDYYTVDEALGIPHLGQGLKK